MEILRHLLVLSLTFLASPPSLLAWPGPCDNVLCIFGATCVENEVGRAQCICNQECPDVVAPVCGSDGSTYLSECYMDVTSCLEKRRIVVESQGACDERDPCEGITCRFGAECVQDRELASCVCSEDCPLVYDPVCGSDGSTYGNECQMHVASCMQQRNITLVADGECEERDPCDDVVCRFGAQCVEEGGVAECLCPEICLEIFSPVCGSDGVDYPNECEMNVAACTQRKNITIVFEGECDPCQTVEYENAICKLDRNRRPMPSCDGLCPGVPTGPVCGSDGDTYPSDCDLLRVACLSGLEGLLIVYTQGPCEQGTHPCADHTCDFGKCMVDEYGMPQCVCPVCPDIYRPVCGSDGVTYHSHCHLDSESCSTETTITVVAEGVCTQELSDLCSSLECMFGSTCLVEGDAAVCSCQIECGEGTDSSVPVCGSDGIDYPSACALRRAACETQRDLHISSIGYCESCDSVVCTHGAFCLMTENGPTCTCSDRCQPINLPVCGSDGQTYASECKLHVMMCNTKKNISVASYGTCDECVGVECDVERYNQICNQGMCVCQDACPPGRADEDKVCGSDSRTYESVCHLKAVACRQESNLTIDYYGPCDEFSGSGSEISGSGELPMDISDLCDETSCSFGGVCRPLSVDTYECVCKFNCPAVRLPVCGSDGVTYGNDCQMREAACEQQVAIVMDQVGTCEDVEMEPCDGDTPLTQEGSSDPYTCQESNGGEDCPSGSYCHIHPRGVFSSSCCLSTDQMSQPSCAKSTYGCCPDNQTEALGENNEGCPSVCDCHPLGSYSLFCEPVSQQCPCKPGVGGKKCDRCEPGFYHFLGLSSNDPGCKPCSCSPYGSRRDDCDQTFGACTCKKGVSGLKCNTCREGMVMTPTGCMTEEEQVQVSGLTCANVTCQHYARCQEATVEGGNATCVCPETSSCPTEPSQVCGDDSVTYASRCQLEVYACREGKDIRVQNDGRCETVIPLPPTPASGCELTQHGCCSDGITIAQGPDLAGCPGAEAGTLAGDQSSGVTTAAHVTAALTTAAVVPSSKAPTTVSVTPFVSAALTTDSVMPTPTVMVVMGCDSSPCMHGGTCQNDEVAPGFTCLCPLGKGGPVCRETVTFDTPSFAGDSYLAFAPMDNAFSEVEIIVEFQSNASEGVLLYEAQNEEGTGDFISLAIVDNHVEFRFLSNEQSNGFDLGLGDAVVIRSPSVVKPLEWHHVRAYRNRRDGSLSVDREPSVTGTSSSLSGALNLGGDLIVGHTLPAEVGLRLVGASQGFVGCIRFVQVNGKQLDLASTSRDIEYGSNIGQCGHDPCQSHPCLNNGTCQALNAENFRCTCRDSFLGPLCGDVLVDQCEGNMCYQGSACVPLPEGGYRCDCPEGWQGELCDDEINQIFIPAFTGNSFIELPSLRMATESLFDVEFLTSSPDGVIFYIGQADNGNGDFISLNMRDGYLEFRFDLGTNIADIRSVNRIPLNEWQVVRVSRRGKSGEMTINQNPTVTGSSQGGASQLNLRLPLYLGGVRHYNQIARRAGITDGLKGAIRYFAVGEEEYVDLKALATAEVNIEEYLDDAVNMIPTAPRTQQMVQVPETNRGRTTPSMLTKTEATTAPVQVIDVNDPVRFDGQSTFKYFNGVSKKRQALRTHTLEVTFKTDQPNGVLLWNGVGTADFQAVAVSDGFAEYAYNLGKGITRIRSVQRVDDNVWHTVTITRNLVTASMQVDDATPVMGESKSGASQLDTDGILYLGSGRSVPGSMSSSYINYVGCIGNVLLDEDHLHLYENTLPQEAKPSQFCPSEGP
ncbi:agrin-like [Diadema setosum]|uniref:agrin-like n=1 Tax=Diadema setosum TaxID=31175 RepID=UPI003B3BCE6E